MLFDEGKNVGVKVYFIKYRRGLVGGMISLLFFFTAPFAHVIFTHLTIVNPLHKISLMMNIVLIPGALSFGDI